MNEQSERRLAAVLLLGECGYTKAKSRRIVTQALRGHGIKIEADWLRKPVRDYERSSKKLEKILAASSDHLPSKNALLHYWLFHLGWLLWIGKNADGRANAPDFCKRLLSEELRPHWERMLREFLALQEEVSHPTAPGICAD